MNASTITIARRHLVRLATCGFLLLALGGWIASPSVWGDEQEPPMKLGIIGLDTSHAIAFTQDLNRQQADPEMLGCRVIAAYRYGSRTIESSASRIPKYTEEIRGLGVEIVDSIDVLLGMVDGVLLETNDGTLHLEQALAVLRAGKPLFIDKPVAAQLGDVVAIYRAAAEYGVPVFSSSSLRYSRSAQEIREGKLGAVLGCDAYSPCSTEPSHSDLFWYGIHGVETLYTVMGTGCQRVMRAATEDFDVAVGTWEGGRIGTFRGIRRGGSGYGGTAFGEGGVAPVGPYEGYRPLVVEIAKFFRSGAAPVSPKETIELYAFMEAAAESGRRGGEWVDLRTVLERAEQEATVRLAALDVKP